MSYLPYDPNTWPETAQVPESRWRARRRWIVALAVYLAALPVLIWWLKRPPPIQPPIASIPLPNGQELRLVAFREQKSIYFGGNETFQDRIRLGDRRYYGGRHMTGRSEMEAWLVFSIFDPIRQSFEGPDNWQIEILDEGAMGPLQSETLNASFSGDCLFQVFQFPVIPRSTPTLRVRASGRGMTTEATIANPLYRERDKWKTASPLPQTNEVDGYTFEFQKVNRGKLTRTGRGLTTDLATAQPVISIKHPLAPRSTFGYSTEWFDGTGNLIDRGFLPASEPVWGLRVTTSEAHTFPFPPDRIDSLGQSAIPSPGQAMVIQLSERMRKEGLMEVILAGPGSFQYSGNLVYGQASAGGGQSSSVVAKLQTSAPASYSFSRGNWSLWLVSKPVGGAAEPDVIFRLRNGDALIPLNFSGSSSSGYGSLRGFELQGDHLKQFGNATSVPLEAILPKVIKTEFFIPRPEFPPK